MPGEKNGCYSRRDLFRGAFLGVSKAAGRDLDQERERKESESSLEKAMDALARSDHAAAEPHLRSFLKNNSSRSDVRRLYAKCLYGLGKYVQARVEFVRLTRAGVADERILALLALAQLRTGQQGRARETLGQATPEDPQWSVFFSTVLERLDHPADSDPSSLESLLPPERQEG